MVDEYAITVQLTAVLSMLSLFAEIWLIGIVCWYKLFTPMMRLLVFYCALHGITILLMTAGTVGKVCICQLFALQGSNFAIWLLSVGFGVELIVSLKGKSKKLIKKTEIWNYILTLTIPILIIIIVLASGRVVFNVRARTEGSKCLEYDPAWIEMITYVGPFFVLLAVNTIMYSFLIYQLRTNHQTLQKVKVLPESTKNIVWFYVMLFFCMGFFRLPSIFFYLYVAAGADAPFWARILLTLSLPLEGFVVVAAVSYYFSLFKRWVSSIRNRSTTGRFINFHEIEPLVDYHEMDVLDQ